MTNSTAILIFSRTAAFEASRKSIINNESLNHTLHEHLLEKTITVAKLSGLPYFLIDESKQQGENFGERIQDAFQQIFSKGFKNVISIGSDCPSLTSDDLIKSSELLSAKQQLVVGPDNRGGVYLLGVSQAVFSNLDLTEYAWNSAQLTQSILKSLDFNIDILEQKVDLNDREDIRLLIGSSPFFRSLWIRLMTVVAAHHDISSISPNTFALLASLRAPPKAR